MNADSGEQIVAPRPLEPKQDTLQKWTLATVLTFGVALLGYLAARDRVSVDAQFGRIDSEQRQLSASVAKHEAEIMVIRAKQDRVLADLAENSRKLDLLLLEARKR